MPRMPPREPDRSYPGPDAAGMRPGRHAWDMGPPDFARNRHLGQLRGGALGGPGKLVVLLTACPNGPPVPGTGAPLSLPDRDELPARAEVDGPAIPVRGIGRASDSPVMAVEGLRLAPSGAGILAYWELRPYGLCERGASGLFFGPSGEGMLDANLDRGGKIALLESIMEVLEGRPGDLGEGMVRRIEAFLIGARRDTDPEEGGDNPAEPGRALVATHSVRCLVVECLIRIAALHKGGAPPEAVLGSIRELFEDPSGAVRSDVARLLAHLLPCSHDLVRGIAASYSQDPDARVQFFLPAVIYYIMQKEPATASAMVGNVLESSARPPDRLMLLLLHLAMALKEPCAVELLRRIADERAFSKELHMNMPFILKEKLLAIKERMDAALCLLLVLLDDPEREVRHKAAFFTLNGFDDNPAIDNCEYIREIAPHLSSMSSLLEEKPLDFGIAEPLTCFLERFWREVPEAALDFLEKIARIHGVKAASESSIAEGSLNVIAGLLQYHSLYDGEWNRCVDVLDTYAAVGWPAALDLLAKMGEMD